MGSESGPVAGEAGGDATALSVCGVDGRCTPVLPSNSGWQGPVELYAGPASDPLPSCGPGYSPTPIFEGTGGLTVDPTSCSPCDCSSPVGGGCAPPILTVYSDRNCSTPCGLDGGPPSSSCVAASGCAAFEATAPVPSSLGSCTPSGGTPTYDAAVTWSQAVRACIATGAQSVSCGSDSVCVQSPAAPFPPRVCMMQVGEVASCPGSPYLDRLVYSSKDVIDTRACSACTCASPTGASCSFPTQPPLPGFRFLDPGCVTPAIPFNVPSDCTPVAGAGGVGLVSSPVFDGGSCAPDGGLPLGAVVPAAIETFCCTP